MLKIFTGTDRVRINEKIKTLLGKDYEIIDSTDLTPSDLPSIFLGNSLFSDTRKILLRDFFDNKSISGELPKYLNTPHEIILFETKFDRRSAVYKEIKDKVETFELNLPKVDTNFIFNIYKVAKTDGKKAIKMLEEIKNNEEPIQFCGTLNFQALKDFEARQGIKEKRVLKTLVKLDVDLKTSPLDNWLLVEAFLLRLSSL